MPDRSPPRRAPPFSIILTLIAVAGGALLARPLLTGPAGVSWKPSPTEVNGAYRQARQRQQEALAGYLALCRRHHRPPDPLVVKRYQDAERIRWYLVPFTGHSPLTGGPFKR